MRKFSLRNLVPAKLSTNKVHPNLDIKILEVLYDAESYIKSGDNEVHCNGHSQDQFVNDKGRNDDVASK